MSEEKCPVTEKELLSGRGKSRNYAFFSHTECEFFPCHKTDDPSNFNCLFCYCPLYALGDKCGGNFRYNKKGIKDCTLCSIPHERDNYDYMKDRFREILEAARKKEEP